MKKVDCLYRVSTKGQVIKDDIPMQKQECRRFAADNGWMINQEFYEKGVSGFKVSSENRDAIQDIKAAATRKEFDVLLVFMFDRLGRRDDETPFVVEWFAKQGIEVWSTKEGQQRFDTHVDKLMNYIRFWQASGESIKTSIRIKTRMEQLIGQGLYTGGMAPFGYKLVKKGRLNKKGIELYDIEIEETEAATVRWMFEKTVKEGYGSFRIANLLNKQGIHTHNDSKFQSNTVNRIMRNQLYSGYMVTKSAHSDLIPSLQIVDKDLFDHAQFIVDQRISSFNTERRIALNTKGKTLFSGNIFCAHCGSRLVVTTYKDHYTRKDGSEYHICELKYVCYHKTRKLNDCDGQTSYIAERVDQAAIAVLSDLFKRLKESPRDKALERKYKNQLSSFHAQKQKRTVELEKLQKELNTLKREIPKALMGESRFSADLLSEMVDSTQAKIEQASTEMIALENEINDKQTSMDKIGYYYSQFISWANEFEHASNEQRKMIAGQLIHEIKVGRGYVIDIEFDMNYQQFCQGL